jgi:hypothetical protein
MALVPAMLHTSRHRPFSFGDGISLANALPFSSGGAAESMPRFHTISLRRHRLLQRLVRQAPGLSRLPMLLP